MPDKCSVNGCVSNYKSEKNLGKSRVRIYSFPKNIEERSSWLTSIPQVFTKITKNMGVCRLHWPSTFPVHRKSRFSTPAVPPSIFPSQIHPISASESDPGKSLNSDGVCRPHNDISRSIKPRLLSDKNKCDVERKTHVNRNLQESFNVEHNSQEDHIVTEYISGKHSSMEDLSVQHSFTENFDFTHTSMEGAAGNVILAPHRQLDVTSSHRKDLNLSPRKKLDSVNSLQDVFDSSLEHGVHSRLEQQEKINENPNILCEVTDYRRGSCDKLNDNAINDPQDEIYEDSDNVRVDLLINYSCDDFKTKFFEEFKDFGIIGCHTNKIATLQSKSHQGAIHDFSFYFEMNINNCGQVESTEIEIYYSLTKAPSHALNPRNIVRSWGSLVELIQFHTQSYLKNHLHLQNSTEDASSDIECVNGDLGYSPSELLSCDDEAASNVEYNSGSSVKADIELTEQNHLHQPQQQHSTKDASPDIECVNVDLEYTPSELLSFEEEAASDAEYNSGSSVKADIELTEQKFEQNPKVVSSEFHQESLHTVSSHEKTIYFHCHFCTSSFFLQDQYELHMESHNILSCMKCPAKFVNENAFESHLNAHTKEEEKYKCEPCRQVFSSPGDLHEHRKKHKRKNKYHNLQAKYEQCNICRKMIKIKSHADMKRHIIQVHTKPYHCDLCCKNIGSLYLMKNHLMSHIGERPYQCDICGNSYSTIGHLKIHKHIHSNEKPYMCHFCGKTFVFQMNIVRHLRIHMGEKRYSCNVCGRRFRRKDNLLNHLKRHSSQRRFQCDVCKKHFSLRYNLLKHHKEIHTGKSNSRTTDYKLNKRQNHEGEIRFHCNICHKGYFHKCALEYHRKNHFPKSRSFLCTMCGKGFYNAKGLKFHLLTHSNEKPFSCNVCGESFKRPDYLKKHILRHSGVKKFFCDICDKGFTQKENRDDHVRSVHSEERPYQCQICPLKFKLARGLKKHMKKVHCP